MTEHMKDYLKTEDFVPRETKCDGDVLFCVSIIIDTTLSMDEYIKGARDCIVQILNEMKNIQKERGVEGEGIVGQIVQYKDYQDEVRGSYGINSNLPVITENFDHLRQ